MTVLGLAITVVSLVWALRGIHYHEILETVSGIDYGWTPLIFGGTLLSIWLRAVRWKVMFKPIKEVTVTEAYTATMIGFMANNVLPMRLGEVVRAYSLGRSAAVSKSAAFATIVVERAFDLMALLLILGVLMIRFEFDPWFRSLGYIALVACLALFAVMTLARLKRELVVRLVNASTSILPGGLQAKIEELLHRFLDGFEVLARGHHILIVALLSLTVWAAMASSFFFGFMTFKLALPISASLVLTVVCALGVMIPSGPGFVGTFEVAAKYGLLLFGVGEGVAVSFALYYHAVQFVPITLLGFYHLWRENFSLSRAVESEGDDADS